MTAFGLLLVSASVHSNYNFQTSHTAFTEFNYYPKLTELFGLSNKLYFYLSTYRVENHLFQKISNFHMGPMW